MQKYIPLSFSWQFLPRKKQSEPMSNCCQLGRSSFLKISYKPTCVCQETRQAYTIVLWQIITYSQIDCNMPFRLFLCKLSPEKTDSGRRLQSNMGCVIVDAWENHRAKAALPLFFTRRVKKALQTRERRVVRCMLHIRTWSRSPCEFDLSDFQGKKEIAANYYQ